jgi:hypothetical protein
LKRNPEFFVKKIRLTLAARLFLAAGTLGAVYFIAISQGIIPSDDRGFLSPEIIKSADDDLTLTLGITNETDAAGIIVANGGMSTVPDSPMGRAKLRCNIKMYGDAREMELAFNRGEINLMATTPARFSAAFRSLEQKCPVAFLLAGQSHAQCAVYSRMPLTGASLFAKKTVITTEQSEPHAFTLLLAKMGGISPDSIDWHFTNSDEETASLYLAGKGDIAVINTSQIKNSMKLGAAVITSHAFPDMFGSVIIAREGIITVHENTFNAFMSAFFEGRDRLAAMKPADARTFVARWNFAGKNTDTDHPASVIADYEGNRLYFRMTPRRILDFFEEYGLFAAKNDVTSVPAEAVHKLLLADMPPPKSRIKTSTNVAYSGGAFTLRQEGLSFDENGVITGTTRHALRRCALYAAYATSAKIEIASGKGQSSYIESVREQQVRTLLTQEYGVAASRIVAVKSDTPFIALSLQAQTPVR